MELCFTANAFRICLLDIGINNDVAGIKTSSYWYLSYKNKDSRFTNMPGYFLPGLKCTRKICLERWDEKVLGRWDQKDEMKNLSPEPSSSVQWFYWKDGQPNTQMGPERWKMGEKGWLWCLPYSESWKAQKASLWTRKAGFSYMQSPPCTIPKIYIQIHWHIINRRRFDGG